MSSDRDATRNMNSDVRLGFMDLLYGVVVGTAFARFDSLTLSASHVLLAIAILLGLEDYLMTRYQSQGMPQDGRHTALLAILDVLVLACWYAVVLSAEDGFPTFLLALAVFFASTTVWGWAFLGGRFGRPRWLKDSDLPPLVASLGAALALR